MTALSPSPSRHVPSAATLVGVAWRRSSHSTAANNCVEAGALPSGRVAVRDSKNAAGPALVFPSGAWTTFVHALTRDGLHPA